MQDSPFLEFFSFLPSSLAIMHRKANQWRRRNVRGPTCIHPSLADLDARKTLCVGFFLVGNQSSQSMYTHVAPALGLAVASSTVVLAGMGAKTTNCD
jgi:hypothetical protein